jgi:hypothetical protein
MVEAAKPSSIQANEHQSIKASSILEWEACEQALTSDQKPSNQATKQPSCQSWQKASDSKASKKV